MYTILKKTVALIALLTISFFSCKNDDSSINDEPTLIDLSKLEQDNDYIEYVTNIYVVSKQIKNPEEANTIVGNDEALTNEQKIALSSAMGFNTVADLENFYTTQAKLMLEITKRYDLKNTNDVNVESIFNQIMRNNRNSELRTGITNKSKNDEIPPGCLDIWDACDTNIENATGLNNADFLNEHFCSAFDEGSEKWTNCTNLVSRKLALEWALKESDWCLCMQADCNWPDRVREKCAGGPITIPDPNI